MSSMNKSLAAVIQAHYLKRYSLRDWYCACGRDCLTTDGSWARHVAEAIDDENIVMERP